MKEQIERIIGSFLERNKQYAIGVYINNGITNNRIGRLTIRADRGFKLDNEKFMLEWDMDSSVKCNNLSFRYDEILSCCKDDYEDEIAETVVLILKNGMKFDFECCGERI